MVSCLLTAVLILSLLVPVGSSNVSVGLLVPLHGASGNELGQSFKMYLASALMAANHVNSRKDDLVPSAQQLLPAQFHMALEVKDSAWSPSVAVGHAFEWNAEGKDLIIGSYRSAVSGPLSLAASVKQTPVISWASTSSSLSDKSVYPLLSRTVPSDAVLAVNMLKIVRSFGWTELGVMAVNDAYGSAFLEEVVVAAPAFGLKVLSQQKFLPANEEEIRRAVTATKVADCRIILAILFDADGIPMLTAAEQEGILGEGYIWLLANSFDPSEVASRSANRTRSSTQMSGWFQFDIHPLMGEKADHFRSALLREPLDALSHPLYDIGELQIAKASMDPYLAFVYDAVWVAAIAASRTAEREASGLDKEALLHNIRNVSFTGATGRVRLEAQTGDRLPDGLPVRVSVWEAREDGAGGLTVEQRTIWQWTAELGLQRLAEEPPVWPGGVAGWELPAPQVACLPGTVFSRSVLRCEPCPVRTEEIGGACVEYNASVGILLHVKVNRDALWLAMALMAVQHVNARDPALIPGAKALLPAGFRIAAEIRGSQRSPAVSVAHTIEWSHAGVDAIVGPPTSFVTGPVALAASIEGTPVTSFSATSSELSDPVYRVLSRTTPSDALLAGQVLHCARALGWKRLGVVYLDDAFGRAYASDLNLFSGPTGVDIGVSVKYSLDQESVESAVAALKESAVRVIISIGLDEDMRLLIPAADRSGLLSRGYVWIKPDDYSPEAYIERMEDTEYAAQQMTGWITMEMTGLIGAPNARLHEALRSFPVEELRNHLPDTIDVTEELLQGECSTYCAYVYDAVWLTAIGMSRTAREADGRFGTDELLRNIRTTTFEGSSGTINLDDTSGDRSADGMTVLVKNLRPATNFAATLQMEQKILWWFSEAEGLVRVVPEDEPPYWQAGGRCEQRRAVRVRGKRIWNGRGWEVPSDGASCAVGFVFAAAELACAPCPPGSFQSGARCVPCEAGSVAPFEAAAKCIPCEEGVAPRPGMTACDACPANTARTPASPGVNVSECVCLAGTYSDAGSGLPCKSCPTGGVCPGGDRVPFPRRGFWADKACRQHGGPRECPGWPHFSSCNPADSCVGGEGFECRSGLTGRICTATEEGWTVVGGIFPFECGRNGWALTLLGMAGVVVVWFGINALASSEYVALNVALLFVQITALISSYGLKWHRRLENLNVALGVANFDVDFVPPSCFVDWGPVASFYFQLLLPIIFGLCYATYFLVTATIAKWRTGVRHMVRKKMWMGTIKNSVSMCCIVYTTLALKCFRFPDGDDYMVLAPEIRCWKGQHLGMVVLASLYIPCVILGLPVLIFLVLRHHMRRGTLHTEDAMWQWGFLHSAYEADFKHRALIALITVAVDEPMLQAAATIAVLTALLAAHSFTRPYIFASVDALDFAGLCGSILYVLGGLLMYPAVTAGAQGHLCDGGSGSEQPFCGKDQDVKDAVSVVCLAAVSLTLVIAGGITLYNVREHRNSSRAMRIIDKIFHTQGSSKQLMETVNKVRLDEVLDGTMLLRWVNQPMFDRTTSSSAGAYVRTEQQINDLDVDLTDYSTETTAHLMRQLCEIGGLVDYLASSGARVQELLAFVQHMAVFTDSEEKTTQRQPSVKLFPLTAMTKFEFRPLLCYWLMVAEEDDRAMFVQILQGVLRANGVERVDTSLSLAHRAGHTAEGDAASAREGEEPGAAATLTAGDRFDPAEVRHSVTVDSVFAPVSLSIDAAGRVVHTA